MGVLVQLGHFSVELSAFVYGEPASLVYAQCQFSNGTKDSNKRVKKKDSTRENNRILQRILKQGLNNVAVRFARRKECMQGQHTIILWFINSRTKPAQG
jgi:hypothetical protein